MNNSKINVINKNISDENKNNYYNCSDDKTPKKPIFFTHANGRKPIYILFNDNVTV